MIHSPHIAPVSRMLAPDRLDTDWCNMRVRIFERIFLDFAG